MEPVDTTGQGPGRGTEVVRHGYGHCVLHGDDIACSSSGAMVRVQAPAVPVRLVGGWGYSCSINEPGDVWCWGCPVESSPCRRGLLGPEEDPAPVPVDLPEPVLDLALGQYHGCALGRRSRSIYCWGRFLGEPGSAAGGYLGPAPVEVGGTSPPLEIAASRTGTCARLENGELWCGRAGEALDVRASVQGALRLFPGNDMCVIYGPERRVGCANHGLSDRRRDGETLYDRNPFEFRTTGVSGASDLSILDAGVCALLRSNEVLCWGTSFFVVPWWGIDEDERAGAVRVGQFSTPHSIGRFEAATGSTGGGRVACVESVGADVRCFPPSDETELVVDWLRGRQ